MSNEHTERKVNVTSLLLGIAGFLVMTGIAVGGFKAQSDQMAKNQEETKSSLDGINEQISDFRTISQKHEFTITALTARMGEVLGKVEANQTDDGRQWETIRQVEAKANGAVQKTDFLEWRIELERKNPTVTSPPLKSQ